MTNTFSTTFRVVACDHCGAPVQGLELGGHTQCRFCGAAHRIEQRDDRPLADLAQRPQLPEPERIARLRQQDGRPLVPSAALAGLLEHGEIPAWKLQEAKAVWQATRREACAHAGTDAGERLLHLTLLLSNAFTRLGAHDPGRHRAMLESALDAVHLPRHRQVVRGFLSRAACREGDMRSAETWLVPCDRASDDLETDSAWRVSRAYLDTAHGRFQGVLAALGHGPADVPIMDALDPLASLLRAHAHERLGRLDVATQVLGAAMAEGPSSRAALTSIRTHHAQLALCPQAFAAAAAMHATHAGGAAERAAGGGLLRGAAWGGGALGILGGVIGLGVGVWAIVREMGASVESVASSVGMILLFVVPFLLAGLYMRKVFGGLAKEGARAKRLMTEGMPAMARVLAAAPTGLTINDAPQMRVDLEVALRDRPAYRAQTKIILPAFQLAALQPGASVAVRVDPADPMSVALEVA